MSSKTPDLHGRQTPALHGDPDAVPSSVLLATVPVGVITYAADGRCATVNAAAPEILNVPRETLLRQNFRELGPWRESGLLARAEETLATGCPFDGQVPVTTTSGKDLCLECRLRRVDVQSGPTLLVVFADISERRRTQKELEQSVSVLKATLDSTTDGILVVDHEGRVTGHNTLYQVMWDISDELLAGQDDERLLAYASAQLRDPESFLEGVRRIYERPEEESSVTLEFSDGRVFERYSRPQRLDERVVGWVWSFRDVTERRRAKEKLLQTQQMLEALARTDPLTGMTNRRAILERLNQEAARSAREGSSLGLGMIDIDHFKRINDTYGHGVGDHVLQALVSRWLTTMRPYDELGRFGGDEFLAVMPHAGFSQVRGVLERIRRAVCGCPVEVEGHQIEVTVTIGGATSRGESVEVFIRSADDALYQAKSRGRNRVVMAEAPSGGAVPVESTSRLG